MNEYIDFPNKQLNDTNLLFNKSKISPDIASLSSMSSMSSSSSVKSSYKNKNKQIPQISQQPKKLINPNKKILYTNDDNKSSKGDDEDESDDEEDAILEEEEYPNRFEEEAEEKEESEHSTTRRQHQAKGQIEGFQGSVEIEGRNLKNVLLALLLSFIGYVIVYASMNNYIPIGDISPQLKKFKNLVYGGIFFIIAYICLEVF